MPRTVFRIYRRRLCADTCSVVTAVKPIFQVILPLQATAPVMSGSVVTADGLKVTQTLPAVGSTNSPTVVSLKSLPQSDLSGGYRVELTGAGCEFKVTLEAL